MKEGYVYAIESAGRVKIGYSADPEKRFAKVSSDAPFPCTLLGYWPGTVADELDVQDKFNAIRQHGEWFDSAPELLAFIANVAVPMQAARKRFDVHADDSPLKAWRKRQGLRQHELGEKLGVGSPFISQLEAGISSASLEMAIKIVAMSGGEVPIESLCRSVETA